MNVANLQLEGMLMAVASINNALVHKGVVSVDEIDLALRKAEASVLGDERAYEDLSPSNRDDAVPPRGVAGGIGRRAFRHGRADQRATAGRLIRGSSLNCPTLSSVM